MTQSNPKSAPSDIDPLAEVSALRLHLLKCTTVIFILAPLFGEIASYYFTGKKNASLYSSITMVIITMANYLWYMRSKKTEFALWVNSFAQMLCFSWGIAVSGGIDATHLVYIPIFPVLNGFISGKKGVILSVGYTTFLCFALVQLDKMNSIPNLAEPNPPELLCYQAIGASFFAGFLVLFHERRRNLGDKRLSIAHSLLSLEKTEVTKSESKLRAIFENVPVGIIKLDSSLKIIESNEAFASLLGYSKSEIHMKTVTDFCCPDNLNSSGSQLKLVPCHPRSSFRSREIKIHRSGKVIVCNVVSYHLS
jgi:PAS domain S-box-containing protein